MENVCEAITASMPGLEQGAFGTWLLSLYTPGRFVMWKTGILSGFVTLAIAALVVYAQEGNNKCCSNNFSLCSGCINSGQVEGGEIPVYAQIGTNQIQTCYTSGPPSTCNWDRGQVDCYVDNVGNTNVYLPSENANCGTLYGTARMVYAVPQCTQGDPNTVCGFIASW